MSPPPDMRYNPLIAIAEALVDASLVWYALKGRIRFTSSPSENYQRARELIAEELSSEDRETCVIYGPPGTGKTRVVTEALHILACKGEGPFDESKRGARLILYVGPTNELAYTGCKRILAHVLPPFMNDPQLVAEILYRIKVLGSKIAPVSWCHESVRNIETILKSETSVHPFLKDALESTLEPILHELERLIRRSGPMNVGSQWLTIAQNGMYLIFTTAFQAIRPEDISRVSEIHVIYDEASKIESVQSRRVLLHVLQEYIRVITSAESIRQLKAYIRKYMGVLNTLIALGDRYQAISLRHLAGARTTLLIDELESIADVPKVALDVTFRLPHPTELPLSEAIYNWGYGINFRAEEAQSHSKVRFLKKLYDLIGHEFFGQIERIMKQISLESNHRCIERTISSFENALEEGRPAIILDVRRPWRSGLLHPDYIAPCVVSSVVTTLMIYKLRADYRELLLDICKESFGNMGKLCYDLIIGKPTVTLSMYTQIHDVKDHALHVLSKIHDKLKLPKKAITAAITSKTIASYLGNEAPIVVHELPKSAWISSGKRTFIVQDPLQLVVGLSRHSLFEIVVGNVDMMIESLYNISENRHFREILAREFGRQHITCIRRIGEMFERMKEHANAGRFILRCI
ncbi:hypothetical protein DRN94_001885 [archaeon]|nr:hypothetical protein [archaeon]